MTCFYYGEEPHLDVTEMTTHPPEILDSELSAGTQWEVKMVSSGQGLGVVYEGRMHMDIQVAKMGMLTETANCSQISPF